MIQNLMVALTKFTSFLLLCTLLLGFGNSSAQSIVTTDNNVQDAQDQVISTPQTALEIRELVSRLSDQQVRALLLERLDAVANASTETSTGTDAATTSASAIAFLKSWGSGVTGSVETAIRRMPLLFPAQIKSFKNFVTERGLSGTLHFIGVFLLAIAIGFLGEQAVRFLTKKQLANIHNPADSDSFRESLSLLSVRLFLDLARLFVFFILTGFVLGLLLHPEDRQLCNLIMFNMIIFPRLMMFVSRFLLAPKRPELRLVHTDDWTANFISRHSCGLFLLIGFNATIVPFNEMNGIIIGSTRLGFWLNLFAHLYVIYIAWQAREGLRRMLLGKHNDVTPMEEKIARYYPYFLIAFTVIVWLVLELIAQVGAFHILANSPQYATLLIGIFIPTMDTFIRVLVTNLIAPMKGEGAIAARAYDSTKHSYLRIGRVLIFGLVTLFLMDIWHIEMNNVASDAVGANIASALIRVSIILSVGYLIWELASLFFNRKLAAEDTAAGHDPNNEDISGGEGGGAGSSRLATILPLFRFTIQTIVIVMTVLIALSNVGINATPLLAGAGVVGIAVGFGAQKLVADVVSGIFFLIDDAFRAGEYVSIEGTVGTVEKISLRSMQLRHHRGGVHTIPYGEIPKLTNYSRDWVLMKLKFTVPFETDLKLIKKIFKQIGNDVVDLPQFSDDLLQPFKSQGVLDVNDVGIVIGGKFMAKPGTQFMMRKELYLRVQRAFDENGIQFARKQVRVKLDDEDHIDLTPKQLNAIAGAATEGTDESTSEPTDLSKP